MIISPNDNNKYRHSTLQNGLKLLIVSNPNAHKAAASLVVNTGSFDDPHDRPGFAHFIEHLLFNGNNKYPQPAQLNDFVAKHGGHCNAWTGTEHSCYHFDVHPTQFATALDMLANMFIEPLFSDESIKKEQEAIHAEYKLKLKDDSRRIQQVHKETANPSHPFHKFSVGNRTTLADLPGRAVIDELHEFWQQHYNANYMTLCLVTPFPVEQIESMAAQLFLGLPSLGSSPIRKTISQPLYLPEQLACFIQIKPIKELHKLNITFALPDSSPFYRHKMLSYIAHIISYEGKHSLFDTLREQQFINALAAGNGIVGSNYKDFNISLELTAQGETQLNDVIAIVFAYLNQLKQSQPPAYLYEEQQQLAQISFDYQENVKALKLANALALNMQHYETEDYIYGDYRMDGLNTEHWQQILNAFTADNARISLLSPNANTNKQAHWYHTEYSVDSLPAEVIEQLNHIKDEDSHYQFPAPNPYLTETVSLYEADFDGSIPIAIERSDTCSSWFKQDVSFRVPKGSIYLGLDLPVGVENKCHQAMMRLFCDLFLDTVSEQHYQAEMAGLNYNLYPHNSGVTLYTSGLSNNQHQLLYKLLTTMITIEFEQTRFNEVKRQLIKHWKNNDNNKPISQLFSLLNSKLLPKAGSSAELAQELNHVTFEQFSGFTKSLFSSLYIEILIYGNWNQTAAKEINSGVKSILQPLQPTQEVPRHIENLAHNRHRQIAKTIDHNDTAAVLFIQGKVEQPSIKEKALFILTSQILAPYAFNDLRQKKQLGYLAGSGYMPLSNIPGLAIYVQSHDYDSKHLSAEIRHCLDEFILELVEIEIEELDLHKQAVAHQYQENPNNLNQKSQQLWVAIGNKDYNFNQKTLIVNAIMSLSKNDLIDFASEYLSGNYPAHLNVCSNSPQ